MDFTFPKRALHATDDALRVVAMKAPAAVFHDGDAWVYWNAMGHIRAVGRPRDTRGYEDLPRKAERVHLGKGLRPRVAAAGDLVRMLEALGRPEQTRHLEAMRRVVELDRGLGLEL